MKFYIIFLLVWTLLQAESSVPSNVEESIDYEDEDLLNLPPTSRILQLVSDYHPLTDEEITQFIMKEVDPERISQNLRILTSVPHVAGSPQDLEQAVWLKEQYQNFGFDDVIISSYNVLLSYPDKYTPNKISVLDEKNDVIYESLGFEPALHSPEEKHPEILPKFNAYSANGTVTGDVVYVYYGRESDYGYLEQHNISLQGKIVLARHGKRFRGNIAESAELRGASGVLLFSDPEDFAPSGPEFTYPHTIFLPELAAQDGTLLMRDGDPLTPKYPSKDGAYYLDEDEANLPKIPVQPISYKDAEYILQLLDDKHPSPPSWQGFLNCSYHIGDSFKENITLQMDIRTSNKMAKIHNVIATLNGDTEPDRYVILGNHRDAWTLGAVDPNSGTAALMEVGRVFGRLKQVSNYRPRRSLVFCSWGAEEYGLIGSMEFTQEFRKLLQTSAVAYLNVDMAVTGNETLFGSAVPMLYHVLYDAAKKVSNPNSNERNLGRSTVYDSWLAHTPDSEHPGFPEIFDLGTGTDHTGFIHNLGIPSMDFCYMDEVNISTTGDFWEGKLYYPLYHTLYETHYLTASVMGGFEYQAAIAKLWGEIARDLADSALLPFSVEEYSSYVEAALDDLKSKYGEDVEKQGIPLNYLENAVHNFLNMSKNFVKELDELPKETHPLKLRKFNDQLMNLERAFINQWGLPRQNHYNHVIYAPSSHDAYSAARFPTVTNVLEEIRQSSRVEDNSKLWVEVKQQLAELTFYVDSAASVLKGRF